MLGRPGPRRRLVRLAMTAAVVVAMPSSSPTSAFAFALGAMPPPTTTADSQIPIFVPSHPIDDDGTTPDDEKPPADWIPDAGGSTSSATSSPVDGDHETEQAEEPTDSSTVPSTGSSAPAPTYPPVQSTPSPVRRCPVNSPHGHVPVSVVGRGTFCAVPPVCAGTIVGNCPTVQPGLTANATCGLLADGVHGCIVR